MIFRIERFLLLFWRTFGCACRHLRQVRERARFARCLKMSSDRLFILVKARFSQESHSIVFAPKISDQLGVSAKQDIIFSIEEAA